MLTRYLTHFVAWALGYGACVLVEWLRQRHRELALRGLTGELPDWEKRARELEDSADRNEIEGNHSSAKEGRRKAQRMRRVARRRLSLGRAAIP